MSKRLNPNLAKIHRNYTVEEVARLYGVHKNTVRRWIKSGLDVCDNRRPVLILGSVLRAFLQDRREGAKRRCRLDELYCVRCRTPKSPAGGKVQFRPDGKSAGRLSGRCPTCYAQLNKYFARDKLPLLVEKLVVTDMVETDVPTTKANQHIGNSGHVLANGDFKQQVKI